jgi:hypothetical protein
MDQKKSKEQDLFIEILFSMLHGQRCNMSKSQLKFFVLCPRVHSKLM